MEQTQINENNEDILILDEDGKFKILKGGLLFDYASIGADNAVKANMFTEEKQPTNIGVAPALSNLPVDTGMEEKMLQPPLPVVMKTGATFYFHPTDEEDASKFENLGDHSPRKHYSLEKIINKIEENYKLILLEAQRRKLSQAIFGFLRDRRDFVSLKHLLSEQRAMNDFGVPANLVENIIGFLKEIKSKINAEAGLVINQEAEEYSIKREVYAIKAESPLNPVLQQKVKKILENRPLPHISELAEIKKVEPLGKITNIEELKRITLEARNELKPGPVKILPKISSFHDSIKFSRPAKMNDNQIMDVKRGNKLYGPVEELAGLNLENFRRLGKSPSDRTSKIMAKINLLTHDSLVRRSAGIKAWKQSNLYKVYLAIGQASMEHNLDVKNIIDEYQNQGKDIISIEEFEAITDLNKQLRF